MGSVVTWGRCMKMMLNIVKPITVGGLNFLMFLGWIFFFSGYDVMGVPNLFFHVLNGVPNFSTTQDPEN